LPKIEFVWRPETAEPNKKPEEQQQQQQQLRRTMKRQLEKSLVAMRAE